MWSKERRHMMFLCKGGQAVKKGTYWGTGKSGKVVLKDDGIMPGTQQEVFFKLPESYLLILPILLILGLPMVIPFRAEFMIIALVVATILALYVAELGFSVLIKRILGKTATFGYAPTTSYLAGKKTKKTRKESFSEEENKRGR
jgi:hypothetical protein